MWGHYLRDYTGTFLLFVDVDWVSAHCTTILECELFDYDRAPFLEFLENELVLEENIVRIIFNPSLENVQVLGDFLLNHGIIIQYFRLALRHHQYLVTN